MALKPSLPRYIGIGAFLTVLAVFVSNGVVNAVGIESRELGLLVLLILFSAGQTSLTYLLIHDQLETTDGDEGDTDRSIQSSETPAGDW